MSAGGNGYYCSSKFALEGLTEALWQEIEPLGLRAFLIQPVLTVLAWILESDSRVQSSTPTRAPPADSSRSWQISNPSNSSEIQSKAVTAIYQEVRANSKRHRMILGSEAYQQIGAKLNAFQSEFESSRDLAFSTDYPAAGPSVL